MVTDLSTGRANRITWWTHSSCRVSGRYSARFFIKRDVSYFVFRLYAYVPKATATNANVTTIAATFEYSGTVGEGELVSLKTG